MTFLLCIAFYVFGALGYYAIAQRRGIKHAWLAWVPIGNLWLLGCISDHYQSVAKGKVKNKRKALLILSIILAVLLIAMVVLLVLFIVEVGVGMELPEEMPPADAFDYGYEYGYDYGYTYAQDFPAAAIGAMVGLFVSYFVMFGVAIAMMVLEYMALYDLYHSCNPDNSVLFLLLSIFLGIAPFLVFACREKDLGMPPRTPQYPPVYGYQPPYPGQPPVYQPQPYQPQSEVPVQPQSADLPPVAVPTEQEE